MTELRLVKNAHIHNMGENTFECVHYETLIATYFENTQRMKVYYGLSPTSNRQIKYLIDFYQPKYVDDLNKDFKHYAKNAFSQPLEN